MNDALITVIGFVAAEPHFEVLSSGTALMSLRIGSTPRRFDRDLGQWRDEDPMFLTVTCWRSLATNLQEVDFKRGDPVIVTGRLRLREYAKDGQTRFSAQIEATTVGHDLSRGVARLQRSQRSAVNLAEDRRQADDLADRWIESEERADGTEELTPQVAGGADESDETTEPPAFRAVA
ncbi:single-stranded DNA-binding protein [Actinoallomurus sp. NPDC050550]|uniref:single-stranded DNA-binding protein n=1 Tax=Actinoallomurus sp. NPDC050550 TaxID=3154937 RepID=UPI0033D3C18E